MPNRHSWYRQYQRPEPVTKGPVRSILVDAGGVQAASRKAPEE